MKKQNLAESDECGEQCSRIADEWREIRQWWFGNGSGLGFVKWGV